jgi:hypothetical protein
MAKLLVEQRKIKPQREVKEGWYHQPQPEATRNAYIVE